MGVLTPNRPQRVDLITRGRKDEAICVPATLAVGALAEIVANPSPNSYNPQTMGIQACSLIAVPGEKLFVLEDGLRGWPKDHLDPWLVNEPVQYLIAARGDVVFALLAAGQNVPALTKLVSNGDGTLIQAPATYNLYTHAVAGTAVTNTTSDTALDTNQYTIPANFLRAGDRIRIRGQAKFTGVHSTDTQLIKMKIGSVTVAASTAYNPVLNDVVNFDLEITVHDIGATGHISGVLLIGEGPTGVGLPAMTQTFLTATAIDTTGSNLVTMSATCSVANTGNIAVGESLTVDNDNLPGVIGRTQEAVDNSAGGSAVFIRTRIE